jgi:AraC family transcriptional regulator, arabinose operon regulatory protein
MDYLTFPSLTDSDAQLPVRVMSVGHWDHQERTQRQEGYANYQWLQCVSGTGELIVDGRRHQVKPGQGFYLLPHEPHVYQPLSDTWELQWISYNGSLAPHLLNHAGISQSGVYMTTEPDILIAHMRNIYAYAISGRPFAGMECSKLLYAFLLDLTRSVWTSSPSATHSYMKLHPVLQFIDANCHRAMTIDEMASQIDVSAQYLCQLFRITLNARPMEYVNRERMNKSKEWMFREPHLKMQEIAARVGFDNPSYFSSVFKRFEGMSPEQFKRLHGLRG